MNHKYPLSPPSLYPLDRNTSAKSLLARRPHYNPRISVTALLLWLLLLPLPALATTILVMGDSLSAAYGIPVEQGWVELLARRLQEKSEPATVINASISGETSAGGRRRLPTLLQRYRPAIVILELGGNDGLRGIPPAQMEANLGAMIEASRTAGARVLLVGMKIPRNYGPRYARMFEEVYRRLAQRYQVAFLPFLLDGVALEEGLMQADGIHPNGKAQPLLLEAVWKMLEGMLQ